MLKDSFTKSLLEKLVNKGCTDESLTCPSWNKTSSMIVDYDNDNAAGQTAILKNYGAKLVLFTKLPDSTGNDAIEVPTYYYPLANPQPTTFIANTYYYLNGSTYTLETSSGFSTDKTYYTKDTTGYARVSVYGYALDGTSVKFNDNASYIYTSIGTLPADSGSPSTCTKYDLTTGGYKLPDEQPTSATFTTNTYYYVNSSGNYTLDSSFSASHLPYYIKDTTSNVYYTSDGQTPATYTKAAGWNAATTYYIKGTCVKNSTEVQMAAIKETYTGPKIKVVGFGIYGYVASKTYATSGPTRGIVDGTPQLIAWGNITDANGNPTSVTLEAGSVPIFYEENFKLVIQEG